VTSFFVLVSRRVKAKGFVTESTPVGSIVGVGIHVVVIIQLSVEPFWRVTKSALVRFLVVRGVQRKNVPVVLSSLVEHDPAVVARKP